MPVLAPGETVEWQVITKAESSDKSRFTLQVKSDSMPSGIRSVEPTTIR